MRGVGEGGEVSTPHQVAGKSCASCEWWLCNHGGFLDGGKCTRFPPRLRAKEDRSDRSYGWIWPITLDMDYCGEWALRTKPRQDRICRDCPPLEDPCEVIRSAPQYLIRKMLKRRIATIEELRLFTWPDLASCDGWGAGSLIRLRDWLSSKGIELAGWGALPKYKMRRESPKKDDVEE